MSRASAILYKQQVIPNRKNPASGLLVIGYGNTLRNDDGVGPKVAEAVAALALPGVRALVCPLLTPELADPVSQARVVIFVDAAVDAPREVQMRKLAPADYILYYKPNIPLALIEAKDNTHIYE